MLYTAVFIFVAVVAFVAVSSLQSTEIPLQQNALVKETGDGFVNVITLAVKGGEGFSYNYTFSYQYDLPPYNYFISGACLGGQVLGSTNCSNVLMLNNDGENLTITQLP
jgi:hypothetical protein